MIDYNASTPYLASRLWKRSSPEALRPALRAAGDQQLDRGPVGACCGDSRGESGGDSGFSEAGEAYRLTGNSNSVAPPKSASLPI
jgi:hypothetical protein